MLISLDLIPPTVRSPRALMICAAVPGARRAGVRGSASRKR